MIRYLIEEFVEAIFDCIEDCIETMRIPAGKRFLYVFYVTVVFLVVSIILRLARIPAFISWKEALCACTIVGILNIVSLVNQKSIKGIREEWNSKTSRLKERVKKEINKYEWR